MIPDYVSRLDAALPAAIEREKQRFLRSMPPSRPAPPILRIESIPKSLRVERRWVIWHYVWSESKGKWDKPPYIATAPSQNASSTDPGTWRSFNDAVASYEDGKCDGIGFVLGDGWVGFDADTEAPEYVLLLSTYTERSPSGRGIHCILRGTKPGPKCRVGPYELYDHGRYFTVTGHHLPETPVEVEHRTPQIATLYALLFPEATDTSSSGPSTSVLSDDEVIKRASASDKFRALWAGDKSAYGNDDSSAAMALCSILAFWTNKDAVQIDRLFRRSGLMRPKWNERRGNSTWGANIIAKVIASKHDTYTGERSKTEVGFVCAQDVEVVTLQWLHYGRFAYGAITLVEGAPEKGKSTVLVDYAARVSTGAPFPGEDLLSTRDPGTVVMLIAEDDISTTVVPRLMAAHADLSRIFFLQRTKNDKGEYVDFHLSDDCARLEEKCYEVGATFIVIDPLVSYLGSRTGKTVNTNNDMEVRKALGPLKELAERTHAAVAAIRHYRKDTGTDAMNAGGGSIGFAALVRVIVSCLPNPFLDGSYVMSVAKNNLVPLSKRPALIYEIVSSEMRSDTPQIRWGISLEMSSNEILAHQAKADREKNRKGSNRVEEAKAFLEQLLPVGVPMKSAEVMEAAKEHGYSPAIIREAHNLMGIKHEKEAGTKHGGWMWIRTSV